MMKEQILEIGNLNSFTYNDMYHGTRTEPQRMLYLEYREHMNLLFEIAQRYTFLMNNMVRNIMFMRNNT